MGEIQGKLVGRTDLTDRIAALEFAAANADSLPAFAAGAHVEFDVGDGETRAYSLINTAPVSAAPKTYLVAVQREDAGGGGSVFMHELVPGDSVAFSAPKNDFPLEASSQAVLLAGGIGVTPMVSMAATLLEHGQTFRMHYSGRSRAVMAYCDVLTELCGDRLQLHFDDGVETALDLEAVIDTLGAAHLYICGPRGMIDAARTAAEKAGVPTERVHVELFDNTGAQSDDDGAFEVEIASTGDVVEVAAGQSIIEALENAGHDVMYDCQRGDCGICQCDVISGTPDHRDVVLSQAERDSGTVMQICVSRSKSPRLVLDI